MGEKASLLHLLVDPLSKMVELHYDEAPVLPEDPDDDVRNEGHDDDEETEEPHWDRRKNGGVDSGIETRD